MAQMPCTRGRVLRPEKLDAAEPEAASQSLRDIRTINRWMGSYRVLRHVLSSLVQPTEAFSVLDIGAGSGDTGKYIRDNYPGSRVTSLDYRINHLHTACHPKVVADAFFVPFREKSFDYVHCSLFLHHFTDGEIERLLNTMRLLARKAVIAIDLERSAVAYYALPASRWLFRWHPITMHDGPISVEAGFRAPELWELARRSGCAHPKVKTHWPWFRISLLMPA